MSLKKRKIQVSSRKKFLSVIYIISDENNIVVIILYVSYNLNKIVSVLLNLI